MHFLDRLLISSAVSHYHPMLKAAEAIEATEVGWWYWEGSEQEYWEINTDFPNVAPPWETFFVEFGAPKLIRSTDHPPLPWNNFPPKAPTRWGWLVIAKDLSDFSDEASLGKIAAFKTELPESARVWAAEQFAKHVQDMGISDRSFQDWSKEENDALFERIKADTALYSILLQWQPQALSQDIPRLHLTVRESLKIGIRWIMGAVLFMEFPGEKEHHPVIAVTMRVKEDGSVYGQDGSWFMGHSTNEHLSPPQMNELLNESTPFMHNLLLAISFLHCKNVELIDCENNEKEERQFKKRHGHPFVRFKRLEVAQVRRVFASEGIHGKSGLHRGLHICRGHFKDYRQRGLFGKYKGMYWWDSMLRGEASAGVIEKEYKLKGANAVSD